MTKITLQVEAVEFINWYLSLGWVELSRDDKVVVVGK